LLIATGRYTIHESINVFGNTRYIKDFHRVQKPLKDNFINKFLYTKAVVQDFENAENATMRESNNVFGNTRYIKDIVFNNNNKFLYTKTVVQDVEIAEDRSLIITETHCRAHRGLDENYKHIT